LALNILYIVLGICAVLVALTLCVALLRLARTLAAMEDLLLTANEELRETLPEVRGSLGNVNDITAGVNVALRTAGSGASRMGTRVEAGLYGVKVGLRRLIKGGEGDG
jgi:hypothetical protein